MMNPSKLLKRRLIRSRCRLWWGTLFLMAIAVLTGGCRQSEKPPAPVSSDPLKVKPIAFHQQNEDEDYNASGVVPIEDGRFLFCDNHVANALYELDLNSDGQQKGDVIRRPLQGVTGDGIDDLEGMTLAEENGRRFIFVASSLSLKKAIQDLQDKPSRVPTDGLLRVTIDQTYGLKAENMPGFRAWLIQQVPELAQAAKLAPNDDGLNIEGLAWDRQRHALLFGLRSPVPDGKPLVLVIKVKDLAGAWTTGNLELQPAIRLATESPMPRKEEQGIRSLEYIEALNTFLVILGKSTDESEAPFALYAWDGQPTGVLRPLPVTFHKKMKPEGVTAGTVGGKPVLVFVDDGGGYQIVPQDALPALGDKARQ